MAQDPKPVVVPPVVATAAPVVAVEPVKPRLSVLFFAPSWQGTKPGAAKRLADVQLLGLFSGMPGIALAGITIAQETKGRHASDVILYMPSASRIGSEKAVTARMSPATQTFTDGTTETVMTQDRSGVRQIDKLTDAIIDAWATANVGNRNPYGVEIALSL